MGWSTSIGKSLSNSLQVTGQRNKRSAEPPPWRRRRRRVLLHCFVARTHTPADCGMTPGFCLNACHEKNARELRHFERESKLGRPAQEKSWAWSNPCVCSKKDIEYLRAAPAEDRNPSAAAAHAGSGYQRYCFTLTAAQMKLCERARLSSDVHRHVPCLRRRGQQRVEAVLLVLLDALLQSVLVLRKPEEIWGRGSATQQDYLPMHVRVTRTPDRRENGPPCASSVRAIPGQKSVLCTCCRRSATRSRSWGALASKCTALDRLRISAFKRAMV